MSCAVTNNVLTYIMQKRIKQTIKCIPISEYIEQHKLTQIDLIKIDVEGHELHVLQGIRAEHFKIINAFIIEVENYRKGYTAQIERILYQNGYKLRYRNQNKNWCIILATKCQQ